MLVRTAYAMGQAASQPAASSGGTASVLINFVPLVLIFGVFYFLVIMPQQKKHKKHEELLNNLKKGDRVITLGGILGVVAGIKENNIVSLEISNGVKIDVLKNSVSTVQEEEKTENK